MEGWGRLDGSRFLDTLGFDVPTCEVILKHAYETFFRFFTQFCTASRTRNNISNLPGEGSGARGRERGQHSMSRKVGSGGRNRAACVELVVHACAALHAAAANAAYKKRRTHPPKDEIRMGHKVRYALEHAPGL
jgi:hypothetical protein